MPEQRPIIRYSSNGGIMLAMECALNTGVPLFPKSVDKELQIFIRVGISGKQCSLGPSSR
jgi:hypothetical protein